MRRLSVLSRVQRTISAIPEIIDILFSLVWLD